MSRSTFFHISDEYVKQHRAKARQLRKTTWWRRKCQRGICHYCNGTFRPSDITMDHIIPLSQGGTSIKSNIVAACKSCNTKKQHSLPWQWTSYMDSLKEAENGGD
ncbi:MAG: HNH endonuclease [Nitrospirae bacterium]|uniref:HNH endonuclease n=1 Tax=Candidatus Magnetobacterium casense TaxID=1455061 RepID=UPI00058BA105|nr:HNH endonuclease [Candidatus Magnetobacterium casensis]MBF0336413.1 HNH endonuclease [Nitrospirota bacterium]